MDNAARSWTPDQERGRDSWWLRHRVVTGAIAWSGGAAFVVSLAWFGWFYFVQLGRVPSRRDVPRRWVAVAVDTLLFGIFALHHSLLARPSAKARIARLVPRWLERSTYVWSASVLLVLVFLYWIRLPGDWYDHRGWALAPHMLIIAAGLWLTVTGSRTIHPLQLAGVRQVISATRVLRLPPRSEVRARLVKGGEPLRTDAAASLVTHGAYALVRHPIYLGWLLIVFGVPHMTFSRLLFAVVSSGYLVIAIPWEERQLRLDFGHLYDGYAARVPWRLIPGVY